MDFSIVAINFREKNYLVHTSCSLARCVVVRKVAVRFVISKCELYQFAWCFIQHVCITIYSPFSFSYVCKYVNLGQGKLGVYDYQSGKGLEIVKEFCFGCWV